jgi:transposase InsO family protein
VEDLICNLRTEHPAWGGRKLHYLLRSDGFPHPPAPSTISDILRRNGLLAPDRRPQRDWQRFEELSPNALWQMDFKGHFATSAGRCHPLTILDDHSRFNLCLAACSNERAQTVQDQLTMVMRRYGLPERMLMDNGSPWGSDAAHQHTGLTAWLIRLGVTVLHGRPYHPQTQGKEERFHRTLTLEVLARRPSWHSLADVQRAFDVWRAVYNLRRPHEALDHDASLAVPAELATVPRQPAVHRVRARRSDTARAGQGAHLLPRPRASRQPGLHRPAGRAPPCRRRHLGCVLLPSEDRAGGSHVLSVTHVPAHLLPMSRVCTR